MITFIFCVACLAVVDCSFKMSLQKDDQKNLRCLTIVFRHGERTPDAMWPKYENPKEEFYPYGLGELTNQGKQRTYDIGVSVRQRYNDFLGDLLLKDTVKAVTSHNRRAQASLGYALAGLFPPKGENKWNNALEWQAIPYSYVELADDKMFYGFMSEEHKKLIKKIQKTEKYIADYSKFEKTLKICHENTGWDMTKSILFVGRLYYELQCMENMGYVLPDWTKEVYPEPLYQATQYIFGIVTQTDEQTQFGAGFLLRDIINEMEKSMQGKLPERKINIYSGHDINVAFLLRALDLFDNHAPTYGEYLILELHENEPGDFFIRILHQDYKQEDPKVLTIRGCKEKCPLIAFYEIVKNKLPTAEEIGPLSLNRI